MCGTDCVCSSEAVPGRRDLRSRSCLGPLAVGAIYEAKIKADKVDDKNHNPREPFTKFVWLWHMNTYGLKSLAKKNLSGLLNAADKYAKDSPRLAAFADLCGIRELEFRETRVSFYLHTLLEVVGDVDKISETMDTNDAVFLPNYPSTGKDAGMVITRIRLLTDVQDDIFRHLDEIGVPDIKNKKEMGKKVDVDKVLLYLLDHFNALLMARQTKLDELFTKHDVNHDGVLSVKEFFALVNECDTDRDELQTEKLFVEVQKLSEKMSDVDIGDAILPEAFIMVADTHHLIPLKT